MRLGRRGSSGCSSVESQSDRVRESSLGSRVGAPLQCTASVVRPVGPAGPYHLPRYHTQILSKVWRTLVQVVCAIHPDALLGWEVNGNAGLGYGFRHKSPNPDVRGGANSELVMPNGLHRRGEIAASSRTSGSGAARDRITARYRRMHTQPPIEADTSSVELQLSRCNSRVTRLQSGGTRNHQKMVCRAVALPATERHIVWSL